MNRIGGDCVVRCDLKGENLAMKRIVLSVCAAVSAQGASTLDYVQDGQGRLALFRLMVF